MNCFDDIPQDNEEYLDRATFEVYEREQKCKDVIRLLLPLAKGYAANNDIEINNRIIQQAEELSI